MVALRGSPTHQDNDWGVRMTDRLDTRHEAGEQPVDSCDGPEHERPPWRRPVVTRIPLAVTLGGTGSPSDGFTGSLPT
jgi:hypothetical protein